MKNFPAYSAWCSAYSYVYHSIGEVFAWIVAFGLFLEYSFGSSAVAIAWAEYLKKALGFSLPPFWCGPTTSDGHTHFGIKHYCLCCNCCCHSDSHSWRSEQICQIEFSPCLPQIIAPSYFSWS